MAPHTSALHQASTSDVTFADVQLPSSTGPPSPNNPTRQKVWIIFGATGHIGGALVRNALRHGDQVTAVGRLMENTPEQMQGWHSNCHGMICDVRVRQTVQTVIDQTLERWKRIDVVANCTGYGVLAACEDQDESDLRNQFNINFMGTLNIIQLTLPVFRKQAAERREGEAAGRYIIFSSTSGALGVPGLGPYCATKYATEGLVESMLYEVDTFGIKATLVQPGHMRLDETNDEASTVSEQHAKAVKLKKYGHFLVKRPSEPYDTPTAPANHAKRVVQWLIDRQPVSALKSAELVWQLGHCKYPPLRLLLGTFAIDSVRDRLRSVTEEIEDWKYLSFGAVDSRHQADKDAKDDDADESGLRNDFHDEEDKTIIDEPMAVDHQAD